MPGDSRLRHDIQLLADAGVIQEPVTGWPVFLAEIDIAAELRQSLDPGRAAALGRVFPSPETVDGVRLQVAAGTISEPERFRGFADVPREQGELSVRLAATRGRFALDLSGQRVSDPADGKEWRADGSYAGVAFGNWFAALGATDRWWGPGWEGSLILSSNARPIPAFSLHRRRALRPGLRWLRWVGPWTMQVSAGRLESRRAVPDARFFAWRLDTRPLPQLQVGFSRTAQWCGAGRPCGLDTFVDLLSGVDNRGDGVTVSEEPGNQLAGFDVRYTFHGLGRPWGVYTQWIGEDEANKLPSANLALLGLETWGAGTGASTYRLHAEYSETSCSAFTGRDDKPGCAYNHSIYLDGYRYRGRVIGHSLDGDGTQLSLGGLWVGARGNAWEILGRRMEVNRSNHPRNTVSAAEQRVWTLQISHTRELGFGTVAAGIGHEAGEFTGSGADVEETRVFVNLSWKPDVGF